MDAATSTTCALCDFEATDKGILEIHIETLHGAFLKSIFVFISNYVSEKRANLVCALFRLILLKGITDEMKIVTQAENLTSVFGQHSQTEAVEEICPETVSAVVDVIKIEPVADFSSGQSRTDDPPSSELDRISDDVHQVPLSASDKDKISEYYTDSMMMVIKTEPNIAITHPLCRKDSSMILVEKGINDVVNENNDLNLNSGECNESLTVNNHLSIDSANEPDNNHEDCHQDQSSSDECHSNSTQSQSQISVLNSISGEIIWNASETSEWDKIDDESNFLCWVCQESFTDCLAVKNHMVQGHRKALCVIAESERKTVPSLTLLVVFCPKKCQFYSSDLSVISCHISQCSQPDLQRRGRDFMSIQREFLTHGYEKLREKVLSGRFSKERSTRSPLLLMDIRSANKKHKKDPSHAPSNEDLSEDLDEEIKDEFNPTPRKTNRKDEKNARMKKIPGKNKRKSDLSTDDRPKGKFRCHLTFSPDTGWPTEREETLLTKSEKRKIINQRYKEKLRADPKRLAKQKANMREWKANYCSSLPEHKRVVAREKTRLRNIAYRQRQKEKKANKPITKTRLDAKKYDERKEKNRLSQQKRRSNMTSQAKRREREANLAYYYRTKI